VLEHTADVGLRVHGRTLAELFENAGLGLSAIAMDAQDISSRDCCSMAASAPDVEQLFVNWLSEILYRMDAEGWAFSRFHVQRCDENAIAGEGWGEQRDTASRTRSVVVKAVTYHQLAVQQTSDGWQATVYFDI
jgi:SHS2 domain-containing protein